MLLTRDTLPETIPDIAALDELLCRPSQSLIEDLKKIDVPTLVIHGDSDRILPLSATGKRTPQFVKGSKLVVVEGGPHGLTWTHAEKVNRELLNFLGQESLASQKAASTR